MIDLEHLWQGSEVLSPAERLRAKNTTHAVASAIRQGLIP